MNSEHNVFVKLINKIKKHLAPFLAGMIAMAAILAVIGIIWWNLPQILSPGDPVSLGTLKKVKEMEAIIDRKYFDQVDEQQQTDMMLKGLVSGLDDKYSTYYTKDEYEAIAMQNDGQMKGIGIIYTQDGETGEIVLTGVLEGAPAEEAGMAKGDVILSVNGTTVDGLTTDEVSALVQQSETDEIVLSVLKGGEGDPVDVTMTKRAIDTKSADGIMLDEENGNDTGYKIGYIHLTGFTRLTAEQFGEAYTNLREEGCEGLIIDLRGNPGGLVDACCDTLSLFMPEGPLVYEVDKGEPERSRDCEGESPIDIPLVLLVNENTASAAEIFTGAVQDAGIATVIGTTTYGKGVEQNSYRLSDGSVLKITTTHYYTPAHRDINGVGITPDIEVEIGDDAETDAQFEKALDTLADELK